MALSPEQNDALIREVDDAVRRDDIMSFWSRYGRLVAILVGVGLAGFGGYLLWLNHQHSVAEAASEDYAVMLKSASSAQLDQKTYDSLTKGGSDGYRAQAELVKAALAAGKDDVKGAVAAYDAVMADGSAPAPIHALAEVRRVALNFDAMQPQDVINTLSDYAVAGNPWFGSAGELTAMAYLKMNKKREAGEMFASVTRDKAVPESIRTRAGQMAGMLGASPDSIAPVEQGEQTSANAQ